MNSPRKVLRRRNSPAGYDEPAIDMMTYKCPVREAICFAMVDHWGNYWTSWGWQVGMKTFVGTRTVPTYSEYSADNLYEDSLEILDYVNASKDPDWERGGALGCDPTRYMNRTFGYGEHGINDSVGYERYNIWHYKTFEEYARGCPPDMVCLDADTIMAGPDSDRYQDIRRLWCRVFDEAYPSPEGAMVGSHERSVKSARSRHTTTIRNQERTRRKKDERAVAVDIDRARWIGGLEHLREPIPEK